MLSTKAVATATVTEAVTLKPRQRRELTTELHAYAEAKVELLVLEEAITLHKAAVTKLLEELGVERLELEGFSAAIVRPQRDVLDKKKFVELGGSLEMLANATSKVASTSYLLITPPRGTSTG